MKGFLAGFRFTKRFILYTDIYIGPLVNYCLSRMESPQVGECDQDRDDDLLVGVTGVLGGKRGSETIGGRGFGRAGGR